MRAAKLNRARAPLTLLCLTVALAGACDDVVCPLGTRKVAGKCAPKVNGVDGSAGTTDAGAADAGAADAGAAEAGATDGGALLGDPCAVPPAIQPTACRSAPAVPTLDGEASAGHVDLHWRWSRPAGTSTFRVRIDAGSLVDFGGATTSWDQTFATGAHTLEVQACNATGCSAFAALTTTVEHFTAQPSPWLGVKKPDFARSPFGRPVPLACRDCYRGNDGDLLATVAAQAKIENAIYRNVDVIELAVTDIRGTLYVSSADNPTAGERPTLAALLGHSVISGDDALLSLELVEAELAPDAFADALLRLLDAARGAIHNGRPMLIQAPDSRLAYLTALQAQAASYPFLAPYLRYWVSYTSRGDIATWQAEIEAEVVAHGFHGVSFAHQSPNLFGVIGYALTRELAVGLFDVPGPGHGEVVIAGMREEVDLISTHYRVDQARGLVQATTSGGYVNVRTLKGVGDPVSVRRNLDGTVVTELRRLGTPETAATYGAPLWKSLGSSGQSLVGGVLDFESHGRRAILLSNVNPDPNEGVLVTAVIKLPKPTILAEGQLQHIIANTNLAGFTLQYLNDATNGLGTVVRFVVRVGEVYHAHEYPIRGGNAAACHAGSTPVFTAPLNSDDSYVLTGHFTGTGAALLFINHQCAGAAPPSISGGIVTSAAPTLIGADPEPGAVPDARRHFRGYLQQVQVQRWGPLTGQESNQ